MNKDDISEMQALRVHLQEAMEGIKLRDKKINHVIDYLELITKDGNEPNEEAIIEMVLELLRD